MREEPINRLAERLWKSRSRAETETFLRPARVDLAARLAIRLRDVPEDPALEPDDLGDGRREVADGDLEARSQVDRVARVVVLRSEHDSLRSVLDVEELSRRAAVAPRNHLG